MTPKVIPALPERIEQALAALHDHPCPFCGIKPLLCSSAMAIRSLAQEEAEIKNAVEAAMHPGNLRVDVLTAQGWRPEPAEKENPDGTD